MSVSDRVRDLVAPMCTDLGLELYDVEHAAGKVRVTVDKPGGVDLEALAVVTRLLSRELDEPDPVPGRYQLEVSSPVSSVRCGPRSTTSGPSASRSASASSPATARSGASPGSWSTPTTPRSRSSPRAGRAGPPPLRRHRTSPHHLRLGRPAQAGQGTPRRAHPCEQRSRGDSVTNIDMVEAVRMLAADKGIPVDTLLQVLADALATAYKRRPAPPTKPRSRSTPRRWTSASIAYDIDEDGELGQRARRHARRLGRIAAQTFRQVMIAAHPRGRAGPQVRGVRQPRGRHRHRHHPADRQPLHPARPGQGRGAAAPGRAGALRAARAGRPAQGVHRRGPRDGQGPPDRRVAAPTPA